MIKFTKKERLFLSHAINDADGSNSILWRESRAAFHHAFECVWRPALQDKLVAEFPSLVLARSPCSSCWGSVDTQGYQKAGPSGRILSLLEAPTCFLEMPTSP